MPQLLKSGSSVWKVGNTIFKYGKQSGYGSFLTPITQAQGSFNQPANVAVDPDGGRIFVINNGTISILNYNNPYSLLQTLSIGGCNWCIEIDKERDLIFFIKSGGLASINYTSPTTTVTTYSGTSASNAFCIDRSGGKIFTANSSTVNIYDYTNPTTLLQTVTQVQGNFNGTWGIVADPSQNRIFVVNRSANSVSILNYTNPTSGVVTTISGVSIGGTIRLNIPNNLIMVASDSGGILMYNYSSPTSGLVGQVSGAFGSLYRTLGFAIDILSDRLLSANFGNSTLSILTNNFY